jgi:hypothetical protein
VAHFCRHARLSLCPTTNALGRYYKIDNGTRIQVVGIVEDGKYSPNITEEPRPAIFLPILQSPSTETWLVVRSSGNPRQLAAAMRTKLRDLDSGLLPLFIQTWNEAMDGALFALRMAALSLGVLGVMGAMLAATGIFGMAAYSVSKRLREFGIRIAVGAQRKEVLQAALGTGFQTAGFWFRSRIAPRNSGQPGACFHRVSGNSARSAGVDGCCRGHGVAGSGGNLDSCATRSID